MTSSGSGRGRGRDESLVISLCEGNIKLPILDQVDICSIRESKREDDMMTDLSNIKSYHFFDDGDPLPHIKILSCNQDDVFLQVAPSTFENTLLSFQKKWKTCTIDDSITVDDDSTTLIFTIKSVHLSQKFQTTYSLVPSDINLTI